MTKFVAPDKGVKETVIGGRSYYADGKTGLYEVNNPAHKKYIDYLESRAIDPRCFPFLVTPADSGRNANRIVVPFTFNNKIVGHTSRYLDDRLPKYINEQQPGYLFGYDLQKKDWEICILVEGIFDALSINGCALGHNTISVEQAELLSQLNKRIIFIVFITIEYQFNFKEWIVWM